MNRVPLAMRDRNDGRPHLLSIAQRFLRPARQGAGLIQSIKSEFGTGCRSAIFSSLVMSCITACLPARID
jgi:hypothetical protein